MNLKITPEIQTALEQYPDGPIRLDNDFGPSPVYLVRPNDFPFLQQVLDRKIREALDEAEADIAAGRVVEWNAERTKLRGRQRLKHLNP